MQLLWLLDKKLPRNVHCRLAKTSPYRQWLWPHQWHWPFRAVYNYAVAARKLILYDKFCTLDLWFEKSRFMVVLWRAKMANTELEGAITTKCINAWVFLISDLTTLIARAHLPNISHRLRPTFKCDMPRSAAHGQNWKFQCRELEPLNMA